MASGAQSIKQNMSSYGKHQVKGFLVIQESHFEVRKEHWSSIQEAEGLFLLTNCAAIRQGECWGPDNWVWISPPPVTSCVNLAPHQNSPCFSFYIFQRELSLNPPWGLLWVLGELTRDEFPLLQIPGKRSILDFGFFQILRCLHIHIDKF